jgi:hypothetical protein
MRAGPLSNSKVISLLNEYFVPVYAVNEDYAEWGLAPAEEKAERERIFKEGYARKMSVGTVHVYILAPDGHLLDTMHVAQAAKADNLIAMLERNARTFKLAKGEPLVAPNVQSRCPPCEPDSLPLHLTARTLDGKGAWTDFPAEDWIVLTAEEVRQFLGSPENLSIGHSWQIPAAPATKVLTHFYPATENNDVKKNTFEAQRLSATTSGDRDGSGAYQAQW